MSRSGGFARLRAALLPAAVALGVIAAAAASLLLLERLLVWAAASAAPGGLDFNDRRWVLLGPWGRAGRALALAVAAAAVLLSVLGTRRERRPLRRGLLIGLRGGAVLCALVVFLQPALELRHVTREPNHIAVLVDDSRSMALAEQKGGPTRAERAARLIDASGGSLETLRRRHLIDFYSFSDALAPLAQDSAAAAMAPRADATLLREALTEVRGRYEDHELAGVIVVSDGIATGRFGDGADDGGSQDFLAGLGAPVHTVWVGRPGLVDLALQRVASDEFAFVRTVVKVEATVRATGMPKRAVPVVLRQGGKVVRTATVTVGGDTPEARVAFEFTPERVGKYVYEFAVPIDPDEAVTGNNTRAFVLQVIRDKLRVLQVAGRPSWDVRALRGLLKNDPNVDLISFFILRTPDDIQLVPNDEMSLIPFPTEELFEQELGSFDVIVLQNFEYGRYGIGPYLENIRRYVERGGGLAMVGGDLAFSSGDYAGTPVADALPVELATGSDPARLLSGEEFRPRLTREGQRHPVTQLRFDSHDNEQRWNALPPLSLLNLTLGPKPGATVLMQHPFLKLRGGRPMPVLVVGEYGEGRSMALMTDGAWRWGFVAAGQPGDDGRSFQKLWENALRWLIRDPELEHLSVQSDQAAYGPAQAPRLEVRLVGPDWAPRAGASVELEIVRDGEKAVLAKKTVKTDDLGQAAWELAPPEPGAYRARARAQVGERAVAAEDVFLVNAERAELEAPAAREDVLRAVAAGSGGRYLGAADRLPSDLPFQPPRVVRVDSRAEVELWSRPWILAIALLLLGAEWALRRRSGLV